MYKSSKKLDAFVYYISVPMNLSILPFTKSFVPEMESGSVRLNLPEFTF